MTNYPNASLKLTCLSSAFPHTPGGKSPSAWAYLHASHLVGAASAAACGGDLRRTLARPADRFALSIRDQGPRRDAEMDRPRRQAMLSAESRNGSRKPGRSPRSSKTPSNSAAPARLHRRLCQLGQLHRARISRHQRALTQARMRRWAARPDPTARGDPFCGGGSIPLEALRVGADAFASDLNPIPVLLNKVILEYIPKYGQRLADEVRKWGDWIKREAEKELAEFYPRTQTARHQLPIFGRNHYFRSTWCG